MVECSGNNPFQPCMMLCPMTAPGSWPSCLSRPSSAMARPWAKAVIGARTRFLCSTNACQSAGGSQSGIGGEQPAPSARGVGFDFSFLGIGVGVGVGIGGIASASELDAVAWFPLCRGMSAAMPGSVLCSCHRIFALARWLCCRALMMAISASARLLIQPDSVCWKNSRSTTWTASRWASVVASTRRQADL